MIVVFWVSFGVLLPKRRKISPIVANAFDALFPVLVSDPFNESTYHDSSEMAVVGRKHPPVVSRYHVSSVITTPAVLDTPATRKPSPLRSLQSESTLRSTKAML